MKPNILTPLFEIVSHIAMETDIELSINIRPLPSFGMTITWYVGASSKPTVGDFTDYLFLEDLDEDKLNRWVAELETLVFEPEKPDNQDEES